MEYLQMELHIIKKLFSINVPYNLSGFIFSLGYQTEGIHFAYDPQDGTNRSSGYYYGSCFKTTILGSPIIPYVHNENNIDTYDNVTDYYGDGIYYLYIDLENLGIYKNDNSPYEYIDHVTLGISYVYKQLSNTPIYYIPAT